MRSVETKDGTLWFEAMPTVWFGRSRTGEARLAVTRGDLAELAAQGKLDHHQMPMASFAAAAQATCDAVHPLDREAMTAVARKLEKYGFECQAGPLETCVDWKRVKVYLGLPS